jgi:hypothetical protein
MNNNKSLKGILILFLSVFFISLAGGQSAYIPPDKPRLVVGIIIEQLRYDQLEKFRNRFGEKRHQEIIE